VGSACYQTAVSVWHVPVAVCTVLDSWWWTERPSKTCSMSFQNKIVWYIGASGWFYYGNMSWCTALWTSNELLHLFRPLVCWSGSTGPVDPTGEAESEDSLWTALPVAVLSVYCYGTSQVKSCSCYKTRKLMRKEELYPCARQCLGLVDF